MSELRERFEVKLFKEAIKETSPFLRSMISRREAKEAAYNTAMSVYPILEELVEALEHYKNQGDFMPYNVSSSDFTVSDYGMDAHKAIDKLSAWLDGSEREMSKELSWPDHKPIEYKGFVICTVCDTIHCPANHESKCNEKSRRGAKEYIDDLVSVKQKNQVSFSEEYHKLQAALDVAKKCLLTYQSSAFEIEGKIYKVGSKAEKALSKIEELLTSDKLPTAPTKEGT